MGAWIGGQDGMREYDRDDREGGGGNNGKVGEGKVSGVEEVECKLLIDGRARETIISSHIAFDYFDVFALATINDLVIMLGRRRRILNML